MMGCAAAMIAVVGQAADRVPDTYEYLIPQYGEKAVDWAEKQSETTRAELLASPNYARVLADMNALQKAEKPLPSYYLLGGKRILRVEKSRLRPYGRIEVADVAAGGRPGTWRTLFDLDAYNQGRDTPFTMKWINPDQECRFPDYDRCMIQLFPGGGQDNIFVEVDVPTGKIVGDGFKIDAGRNFVSWFDDDTLLVAHTTEGAPALPSQFPAELKVWKRGTPLAKAPTIFAVEPADSLFEFRTVGAAGHRRVFLNVSKTYERFQLKEITLDGKLTGIPFPEALNNFGTPKISGRYLAVQLDAPATVQGQAYAADTIIAYDLETGTVSAVMVPPKGVYLTGGFSATRSGFAIVGVRDLQRILYLAKPAGKGWSVREALTEAPGLTLQVASDEQSDALLLREAGLTAPTRYSLWDAASTKTLVDAAEPLTDLSDYAVEIRSARSKDGTLVDYYLMRRKGERTGPTPTIVQGYGGFGISNDPAYFCCSMGASWKSWFDRGGALAMTAIRGGGERGGAWHRDAMGVHKIRSFEDFVGVAEDLQRSGFTDPAHTGILGHSEGGLLVAGTVAMRPDLYGAALVGAPITDNGIIGHGDGGIGAGLTSENGDWNDPSDRQAMALWDPYSNIRPGTRYPPTLTIVATSDNQVGPSHARRFVAKLQEVGAPALLLEGKDGGHDYPDAYSQTADAALPMTFFIDHLMPPR
ncbi:prolyl oligopeptidase family serine peptidase [Sphingopyxis panaciterrae]